MKMMLVFGDSIAHGVGGQAGGWVDRFKATLSGQLFTPADSGCVLYELGIPGNTARDVAGRFEIELLARAPRKNLKDTYVVFAVGTNDSRAANNPTDYLCEPDEYATNVQACIKIAKEHAGRILCVGLTPVDQAKASPRRSLQADGAMYFFSNRRLRQFEAALADVCKTKKVTMVPLFGKAPPDWQQHYLADGLHPNDAGHEWMYDQIKPHLQRMLGQS